MKVHRSDFEMVKEVDTDPDLSWLITDFYYDEERNGILTIKSSMRYSNKDIENYGPGQVAEWIREDHEEYEKYSRGEKVMYGVRAKLDILFYNGVRAKITSPGVWGIESDSREGYFEEIFQDECNILTKSLIEMGIEVVNDRENENDSNS